MKKSPVFKGKTKIIKKLAKKKGLKVKKLKVININPEGYKGFPTVSN